MKKNNALQIISSKIVVSSNSLSEKGYYVSHKVKAILPGCRKASDMTFSPMYGYIWVKNLWSYNGAASVSPEDWAALVKLSPVVSDSLESFKYPLTPEVIADAYKDALRITEAEVLTDRTHVHPKYTGPEFNPILMFTPLAAKG
jgi:hypothetical protein